jgi:predicted ATP-grasp superfamily ATP-dependent carboligase
MGSKAIHVQTQGDLPAAYERAKVCGALLLQEFVPGGEDAVFYLGSYLDRGSRALATFTGRRLRQSPPMYGLASLATSVWVPEVAEAGVRLLREMGWHGVSHVEFKRDPRDGRYKLMEINTRHYGTNALATACGVDLTGVAYDDALGRPRSAPRQCEGVRWVHARRYLGGSVRAALHGDRAARRLLGPLRGVRVDGVLSLDDPLPGAAEALVRGARLSRRGMSRGRGLLRRGEGPGGRQ